MVRMHGFFLLLANLTRDKILELMPFLLRPPSMLFVENVVGFETSDTHAKLIEILEKTNFITQEFILTPLQFGIPYSRPRYFCLAKRKPSSFVNECLNNLLIQSSPPLFGHFDTVADDDNSSKEDRQNLLQSCQPIEKFIELKNLSNDIAVESEALRTDLSNDAPRTLGENNGHEYESLDQYYVHPSLIERWGSAMDVVYPIVVNSDRSCCYSGGAERSGTHPRRTRVERGCGAVFRAVTSKH
ncbi:tRNA (cytosine(38)-C(5))-methyltransferase 2-like [Glycine soja]|uniref:tRNA (cytosine(38)-C(5))-methyltransferase 2-like n=1 Tax=Glycine soja TaxID=3848 RepID=UPI00103A94D4|nr:tRNA (cytosine(38)-C(5))-methyltransferase 2-like [Glycine soja]